MAISIRPRIIYALLGASLALAAAATEAADPKGQVSQAASGPVRNVQFGEVAMVRSLSDSCPANDGGVRRQVFPIRFSTPFSNSDYAVTVGLSEADVDHTRNFRIGTNVVNKTPQGMTIVAYTWCETNIYSARFSYMAVGG
jgi:hypothetical protein